MELLVKILSIGELREIGVKEVKAICLMAKSLLKTIAKRLLALTSSDQRGAITSLTSITSELAKV